MLAINITIILLIIGMEIIHLLSRKKLILNQVLTPLAIFILIVYNQISQLIYDYELGYIGIKNIIIVLVLFLLILIWGYRRNRHIYSIYNTKKDNVLDIIENYLQIKDIKYELKEDEIYLKEFDKYIYIYGLLRVNLNCIEIKDMNFYEDFINNIKFKIRK